MFLQKLWGRMAKLSQHKTEHLQAGPERVKALFSEEEKTFFGRQLASLRKRMKISRVRLARLLDESVRETDYVARYGGEEFVVVMPQTDLDGAAVFAERLRCRVESDLPITVSGGLATAREGDNTDTLLARADTALYNAKSAGRNCIFRHTGDENGTAPQLHAIAAQ